MTRDADVVVVGLGAIGSAAACWAAARPGVRVIGLEQFDVDHVRGASNDVSRIIRLSYHRRDYVRLAKRAYATWAEIEDASRDTIVTRTGGLDVGPVRPEEGIAIDLEAYATAMTAEGVGFERLAADEITRRWPAWRLDDGDVGLFQPEGGIANPRRGNAAHRRLARDGGAELREQCRVRTVQSDGAGEAVVELASGERITAGSVFVAADAWTNELLEPLGLRLPLTVTQEQVTWFIPAGDPGRFEPDRFPVWIWMDEPSFYGFPTFQAGGPKVGQDVGGREVTADTRTFERDEDAFSRVTTFADAHLPGLATEPIETKTCLYTLTPDRDFVIDRVPGHPAVQVVLGSAHAYKFASVLGRILVERGLDGSSPSDPDLEAFRLDRPELATPTGATRFVV